ncbi:MAG: transglutaminase protein [Blastococcus sp.]|jgi:transglutaminase-like putative cysteine protease|nr:transglutaminase protein [Blastococcus sp.]
MSAHNRPQPGDLAPRARAARVVGVLVLAVPGVIGFDAAFGTPRALVAAGAGLLLGALVGWVSALRRLSAMTTAALTVLVCALAAGPVALPGTTIGGVVPTSDTFGQLAAGVVRCWRNLVTSTAPTGALGDLLLVPFVTGLLAGVLGVVLALRTRHPSWALVPTGAVLLVSVLVGTAQAVSPLFEGGLFAVLAVAWIATTGQAWTWPNATRAAAGVALLALAAAAASVLGPVATNLGDDRYVLREAIEPPFDIHAYPSPLNGFRKFVKDHAETSLFTLTGAPGGSRIRLATMDAFDGAVWNVAGGTAAASGSSGSFHRLPLDSGDAADVTVQVEVQGLTGVWLPGMGDVLSVAFTGPRATELGDNLRYNQETGTGIVTTGLRAGDGYSFRADLDDPPTADELSGRAAAVLVQPEPQDVPAIVTSVAADAASDAQGAFDRAQKIAKTLRTTGYFSNGLIDQATSRAGHGSGRLNDLLAPRVWIGDEEQYASAAGLMTRQLRLPSRVVMGFEVPGGADDGVVITGAQVTAWVEVAFDGVGWVSFDVTPDETRIPPEEAPEPAPRPKPATQQPPPPVEEPPPPMLATSDGLGDQLESSSDLPGWLTAVLTVAAWVGGALLLVALVCGTILGLKLRRRRRRRLEGSADQRVAAGWWEVLDAHRDHGADLPPSGTRREIASALGRKGTREVAEQADDAVFAGGVVTDDRARSFWELVDRELVDLSAVGPRARWRARLSLRSLRRKPR